MVKKKITTIRIDPALFKKFKKKCVDQDIEISEYIESLITRELNYVSIPNS